MFIIIRSFIEVVKFLFSLFEVKDNNLAFLSANLSQDPLENLDVRGKEGAPMTILLHKSNTQTLKFYMLLTPFFKILFEETAGKCNKTNYFYWQWHGTNTKKELS